MNKLVKTIAAAAIGLGVVVGTAACGGVTVTTDTGSNSTPEGSFKIGDNEITTGLPSGWPSDVPTPQGLTLNGGGATAQGMSASWSGTGSAAAVEAQLNNDFINAGFTKEASFTGGGNGGLTTWKKGSMTVQVIVSDDGTTLAVNETVLTGQQ